MKTIRTIFVSLFLFLSPSLLLAQGDSLKIAGKLISTDPSIKWRITFSFTDNGGKEQYYGTPINNGVFELKIPKQARMVNALFRIDKSNAGRNFLETPLNLFLETDDIYISGSCEELGLAEVSGGKENEEYAILRESGKDIVRKITSLQTMMLSKSSDSTKTIYQQISRLNRLKIENDKQFISGHSKSFVSVFLLSRMENFYTADDFAQAFDKLEISLKETSIGKDIQKRIHRVSITSKGKPALPFERYTINGDLFRLSDLQGKVLLLDFWGSWCGACIYSFPHLKELYARYKDRGFEIVGIAQERGKSLEQYTTVWKDAVNKHKLPWLNVLNNDTMNNMDIVKSYQITGFPTKILLDENGKVILRITASATDDLDKELAKIYGF